MSITLSIALLAGVARLGASLPAAGDWWIESCKPGSTFKRIEASGYAFEPCHVVVTVRRYGDGRVYWLRFEGDEQ